MVRRLPGSVVGEAHRAPLLGRDLYPPRAAAAGHQLPILPAEGPPENRLIPRPESRLEDPELVRGDLPAHDRLAEPARRVDEHDVAEAALRIQREHDPRRAA